jgi:hypothetical protein
MSLRRLYRYGIVLARRGDARGGCRPYDDARCGGQCRVKEGAVRRIAGAFLIAGLALLMVNGQPLLARDTTVCTGTLMADSIWGVSSDVDIPAGATCTANDLNIYDNVTVESDATLVVQGGQFLGNITANDGSAVMLSNTPFNGNLMTGNAAAIQFDNVTLHGNILADNVGSIAVTNSEVDGNIQAQAGSGTFVAFNDTINGNILIGWPVQNVVISGNTMRGNAFCNQDPCPMS